MNIIPLLVKEFEQEAGITRKFFPLVPADKLAWKPHEKSMDLKNLCVHIAELPSWVEMALTTSGLDFSTTPYKPSPASNAQDLLNIFETSFEKAKKELENAEEKDLLPSWTLRNGQQILGVMTKYEMIRGTFAHITHHRAQLGVYFRLLNIPVPGSYGHSADEKQSVRPV